MLIDHMDGEFPGNRDEHGDGSRGQGNRIGEDEERHGFFQPALEADDSWIYQIDHARVESQRHDMEIGQKDLVEKPGYITDEPEPLAGQVFDAQSGNEDRRREAGHDGAGDCPESEVEGIEAARKDDPGAETDAEREDKGDCFFDPGGKRRRTLPLDHGKVIW